MIETLLGTMLETLFQTGSLNFIYTVALAISFFFAVISLVGAEVGDALDFDADVDAEGFDFVNISPFAIAMFGATFGLVGLITRLMLDMGATSSILWSGALGVVIGGLAQVLFIYVLSPTKSSHFSLSEDAVSRIADVIITIPADGMGQVAYDNVSGRMTLGARSLAGEEIKRGRVVVIEKVVGRVAHVRAQDDVAGA